VDGVRIHGKRAAEGDCLHLVRIRHEFELIHVFRISVVLSDYGAFIVLKPDESAYESDRVLVLVDVRDGAVSFGIGDADPAPDEAPMPSSVSAFTMTCVGSSQQSLRSIGNVMTA
jgi:hypothetical protein